MALLSFDTLVENYLPSAPTGGDEETILTTWLSTCEKKTAQSLGYPSVWDVTSYVSRLHGIEFDSLLLPFRPLVTVTSCLLAFDMDFATPDFTLVEDEDFEVENSSLHILPNGQLAMWPDTRRCIQVTYTAGYTANTLPPALSDAVYQTVATEWQTRSLHGVMEFSRGNVRARLDSVARDFPSIRRWTVNHGG